MSARLANETNLFDGGTEQRVRSINPLGKITTSIYDDAGRPRASITPLGFRSTIVYDAAGQRVAVRDANGKITTSVYDPAGRPVATIDANAKRTSSVYDAAGRRIALVDANGNRNTFTIDDAGRTTRRIDALGRRTTLGYNTANQQTQRTDARGNRTSYVYDDAGRRYPDATRVTLAYDALGRTTKMDDATGRTSYSYDDMNRPRTVTNPAAKRITHSYTALGQRNVTTEPGGGRFSHVYDDAARLKYLVNPESQRTSYSYDNASRVTVQKLANGARASYTHDDDNRLTLLSNLKSDGSTISSFDYKYDSVGNRTRVLEADGSRVTWTYDNLYRLARAHRTGTTPYHLTHTYDPVGNRQVNIDGGARTTSVYDAANQIRCYTDSSGITTHTYDATGNLSVVHSPTNQRTTHTWDAENRMTLVKLPSGTRNTMTYNGTGLRIQKQDSAGTTKPIWDGQNILAETDGSNVVQVVYTQSPNVYGNLISQRRSATTKYYHFDAMGSTDRITDSSQTVTDSVTYDPWGKIRAGAGSTVNSFKFIGRQGYCYDVDLLEYYLRARFYDPPTGRFVSQDPIFFVAGDVNLFRYANGNPTNIVDPSGLVEFCIDDLSGTGSCGSGGPGVIGGGGDGTFGGGGGGTFGGGGGGTFGGGGDGTFGGGGDGTFGGGGDGTFGGGGGVAPPTGTPTCEIPPNCTIGTPFQLSTTFAPCTRFPWRGRGTEAIVLGGGWAAILICAPGDTTMVARPRKRPIASGCQPSQPGKVACLSSRGRFLSSRFGPVNIEDRDPDWLESFASFAWEPNPNLFLIAQPFSCCCAQIGFAQIVRNTVKSTSRFYDWAASSDWKVDKGIPYPEQRRGFPLTSNPCENKPAAELAIGMTDHPGNPKVGLTITGPYIVHRLKQEFETCVICLSGVEGPQNGGVTVYGCLTWGHEFIRKKRQPPPGRPFETYYWQVDRWLQGKHTSDPEETLPFAGAGKCPPSPAFQRLVLAYFFG